MNAGPSAASGGCPASGCLPHPTFHIINVTTYTHQTLVALGEVGSCAPGANGKCSISHESSKTTSLEVDLGAEKGWAAGQLNVSLSATSATSVTCQSPAMTANQVYVAYPLGTYKTYQIHRDALAYPPVSAATSGTLHSRQPLSDAIGCRVEAR
jgi:hypothetical protein